MVLKFRGVTKGHHVHLSVFAGPFDGNLAHCGELTFQKDEYEQFKKTVEVGEDTVEVGEDTISGQTIDQVLWEVTP